jgi:hypothetical protein
MPNPETSGTSDTEKKTNKTKSQHRKLIKEQNGLHQKQKANGPHQKLKANGPHQKQKANGPHQKQKANGPHQKQKASNRTGTHINAGSYACYFDNSLLNSTNYTRFNMEANRHYLIVVCY